MYAVDVSGDAWASPIGALAIDPSNSFLFVVNGGNIMQVTLVYPNVGVRIQLNTPASAAGASFTDVKMGFGAASSWVHTMSDCSAHRNVLLCASDL